MACDLSTPFRYVVFSTLVDNISSYVAWDLSTLFCDVVFSALVDDISSHIVWDGEFTRTRVCARAAHRSSMRRFASRNSGDAGSPDDTYKIDAVGARAQYGARPPP